MRGSNMTGRFTIPDEVLDIRDGMHQDLQMPAGQSVQWWLFDSAQSEKDAIYDVASSTSLEGRAWQKPITVPCLGAMIIQGETHQDDRGFYNVDRLHLTINMDDVRRLLPTLPNGADYHINDRVTFRGQVYQPFQVWARGQVARFYTVLSVDLLQVKNDELVNDPQFAASLTAKTGENPQVLDDEWPGVYDPPGP